MRKSLLEFIDAMDGSFGCRERYEESIIGRKLTASDYACMSGYYYSLLQEALSLVPPAFIDDLRRNRRGEEE
jgi:hypothetical protein